MQRRHRGMSLAAEETVMDSIFYIVGLVVVVLVVAGYLGLA